jgi:Spy/CpxP family protein refolding chaperone
MKKLFFTATLFLGLTTLGFSQEIQRRGKLTPEERAQKKTELLSKKLSLSKEQQDKVYAINLQEAKKIKEFRSEASKERTENMDERKAFFKENEDRLEQVLNAEQKKIYEQMKKERLEKMKDRNPHFQKKDSKEKVE